jgi:limonene-1,2-epoxide hydrolase
VRHPERLQGVDPLPVRHPERLEGVDPLPVRHPERLEGVDPLRLPGGDDEASRVIVAPPALPILGADMSASANLHIARTWLRAFNARDVDALVALYDGGATHTSPKLRALHPDTGGCIRGKAALAEWWHDALARLPSLRYEATALTADDDRVLLEYVRHVDGEPPMPVAEVFEIQDGRIAASRVYHG